MAWSSTQNRNAHATLEANPSAIRMSNSRPNLQSHQRATAESSECPRPHHGYIRSELPESLKRKTQELQGTGVSPARLAQRAGQASPERKIHSVLQLFYNEYS